MKLASRFLIALCVFFLSGFGQLFANDHKSDTDNGNVTHLEEQHIVTFDLRSDNVDYAYNNKTGKTFTTDNETEENELTSSKKWLDLNNDLTSFLSTDKLKHFRPSIKKSLPLSKHLSLFPSCKWYIMFRVIRI